MSLHPLGSALTLSLSLHLSHLHSLLSLISYWPKSVHTFHIQNWSIKIRSDITHKLKPELSSYMFSFFSYKFFVHTISLLLWELRT